MSNVASEEYNVAIFREGNLTLADIEMDRVWNHFKFTLMAVKGIERWIDKNNNSRRRDDTEMD